MDTSPQRIYDFNYGRFEKDGDLFIEWKIIYTIEEFDAACEHWRKGKEYLDRFIDQIPENERGLGPFKPISPKAHYTTEKFMWIYDIHKGSHPSRHVSQDIIRSYSEKPHILSENDEQSIRTLLQRHKHECAALAFNIPVPDKFFDRLKIYLSAHRTFWKREAVRLVGLRFAWRTYSGVEMHEPLRQMELQRWPFWSYRTLLYYIRKERQYLRFLFNRPPLTFND